MSTRTAVLTSRALASGLVRRSSHEPMLYPRANPSGHQPGSDVNEQPHTHGTRLFDQRGTEMNASDDRVPKFTRCSEHAVRQRRMAQRLRELRKRGERIVGTLEQRHAHSPRIPAPVDDAVQTVMGTVNRPGPLRSSAVRCPATHHTPRTRRTSPTQRTHPRERARGDRRSRTAGSHRRGTPDRIHLCCRRGGSTDMARIRRAHRRPETSHRRPSSSRSLTTVCRCFRPPL